MKNNTWLFLGGGILLLYILKNKPAVKPPQAPPKTGGETPVQPANTANSKAETDAVGAYHQVV